MALQEKVALVTGVSRGSGRAVAEPLGKDEASIVVNYFANRQGDDESALADEVVRAIERNGGAAVTAEAEVSDARQLRGLFDLAEERFGELDILVNNAAAWRFVSRRDPSVKPGSSFVMKIPTNTPALAGDVDARRRPGRADQVESPALRPPLGDAAR